MNLVNYSSVNYNKNIFTLREKVAQDVYLRTSLYSISNRKNQFKFKEPTFLIVMKSPKTKQSFRYARNNTSTCGSNHNESRTVSRISTIQSNNPITKTLTLYDSLVLSKEKKLKDHSIEIRKENILYKQRLKRVSSPLSRKKLDNGYYKSQKYMHNLKKIKSNEEIVKEQRRILSQLPKLYITRGKMKIY